MIEGIGKVDSNNIDSIEVEKNNARHSELEQKEKKGGAVDEETPPNDVEKERAEAKEHPSEKKKSLKKKLLDSLDEKDIKKLLSVKEELEAKNHVIEEKDSLLLEYEDLLKRKQAEFENYTKRVKREFDENKKYATAELVLDIITTIDNFERAIDSAKSSNDFDALLEGIVIVENQLKNVLEKKYGVIVIDDVGEEFDPNIHDAIMMEESSEYEDDTVIENLQKGYQMYDRVLRPAKVKVAKVVSPLNEQEEREDDELSSSEKGV